MELLLTRKCGQIRYAGARTGRAAEFQDVRAARRCDPVRRGGSPELQITHFGRRHLTASSSNNTRPITRCYRGLVKTFAGYQATRSYGGRACDPLDWRVRKDSSGIAPQTRISRFGFFPGCSVEHARSGGPSCSGGFFPERFRAHQTDPAGLMSRACASVRRGGCRALAG
jgi:hypothetical protein